MKLSVSHIAWPAGQEEEAMEWLRGMGVGGVELAPRRAFGDLEAAREDDVRALADWYSRQGMAITSFQALLFGVDGVELFGTEDSRRRMARVLVAAGKVAGWCGAGPMVFGSPKNRLKGGLTDEQAMAIAVPFFREVGDACAEAGSCLVMEANPEAYGADFCTRLEQAARLVERVDSPGFGLHVDAGGMALSGEDFEGVLRHAAPLIRHVHASQVNLESFDEPADVHARLAGVLQETGYAGAVSIEMRAQVDVRGAVEQAVRAVRGIYFQD